ncbi:MAG: hypothetical protein ABSF34_18465, partial [Verrucomicrobiota bacterium]
MSVALDDLIPHRAPMQWINALADCSETTATATACFQTDDFAVVDGKVIETALVECVAQTVAAEVLEQGVRVNAILPSTLDTAAN